MYSVFSNYLSPLGEEWICNEETKPSEIYNRLRIAYNQGVKGILESTRIITSDSECESYEIIYNVWENKELHEILNWINKKIVLELGVIDYRAIDVRLRIVTSRLNKLVLNGTLQNRLSIAIHDNLVQNVRSELSAINTEDLPFLG